MIKKLHFKSLLLLAAMLLGASSAWADDVYEKYSGEITEGEYIIAYTDGAMQAAISSNRLQYQTISDADILAQKISSPEVSIVWTIAAKGDYYTLYNASTEKYAASTGTKNQAALLDTNTDDKALWSISKVGDYTFEFVNKKNAASSINSNLRRNGTYGFACYGTSTGGPLALYKKVESSQVPSPTFSPVGGTYTSAQDVEISTTTEGATIYYTTDNTDPTTSSSTYYSAIPVSSTTTIKAIAVKGSDVSPVTSATYTIVSLAHAGTDADPYTVADARAAIDAGTGTQSVYATGIVSAIPTAYSTEYSNITFNFVDNTGDQTFLQAYRCIGDEAANVQVGDIVVVSGNLTKFNTTYEFAQGCTLVSLTKSVAPVITAENVNIAYNATDGNIEYAIVNVPDPAGTLNASVPEGSWLTLGTVGESVPFTCQPNTLATARTATVTLTYTYGNNQTATKDVTVTQAGTPTTASLPFEFDGGKSGIEETEGLTQDGLGTDYNSSPKLKFDGTGDWLILNFNERPGKLTFDIKGNSFSGGTFKVQTSEDGVTYTDLKTYTEISTTQNEEFKNLGENVRYIKWIYTTRVSGNVALGNIALAKYKEPQSYTLTVSGLENVFLYVFDAAAPNDPLIANGGIGTAQVVEETQVMISPDPVEGYTLETLLVDGVDHKNELSSDGSYTFTMPNKDITITATVSEIIPVETKTYTLATSITSGKHYVIASGIEDDVKVMGAQNSNNRAAVNGTVSGTTLSVTSDAGATEFVIYGPDAHGYYAIYDAPNGYLYAASSSSNHLKSQTTNNANGKWNININNSVASIVAQGTNSRNVMQYNSGSTLFSCYGSASQGSVYLYEKDGEATPTETVHVTDAKYATYCSENALDFDGTGLTAYIAKLDDTTVSFEEVTSVPSYTGVLLKADAAGDFTVGVATTVDDVTGNAFIGVTEETSEEAGIFVLMNTTEYGVGFYKAENAFTVGAHTAYIPALPSASRNFIAIDDATAIKAIETAKMSSEIYNLAGQRVKSAQKGLYIIGGKKVVIK